MSTKQPQRDKTRSAPTHWTEAIDTWEREQWTIKEVRQFYGVLKAFPEDVRQADLSQIALLQYFAKQAFEHQWLGLLESVERYE